MKLYFVIQSFDTRRKIRILIRLIFVLSNDCRTDVDKRRQRLRNVSVPEKHLFETSSNTYTDDEV